MCRDAITYTERELGLNALRPPHGQVLLRRLQALHARLEAIEQLLARLSEREH